MLVYKVVKRGINDQLHSATPLGMRLSYEPGKPTVPPENCGPLAAFGSFGRAKEFACELSDDDHPMEVWKAEGPPSSRNRLYCPSEGGGLRILDGDSKPFPEGTVLMEQVTLLRLAGIMRGEICYQLFGFRE